MNGTSWQIDVFCRVIDNFGDAGLAYRLCKSFLNGGLGVGQLRLIIDRPEVFLALEPRYGVWADTFKLVTWQDGIDWNATGPGRPDLVLETFGCGLAGDYLDWLAADQKKHVLVNLEYLSAEDWVREFHRIPGLAPYPLLKRFFFMPGFTPGTGGLFHDPAFIASRAAWQEARRQNELGSKRQALLNSLGAQGLVTSKSEEVSATPWICVFTYEYPFAHIVADLAAMAPRPLVLLASGRGSEGFLTAWEQAGQPFEVLALPFLPQEVWDEVLLASDLNIVRGEESLARAVLCGTPFVWHAYLQERREHLLKVEALISALISARPRPNEPEPLALLTWAQIMRDFNDRLNDSVHIQTGALAGTGCWKVFLDTYDTMGPFFESFTEMVESLGDLAQNLLTFTQEVVYDANSKILSVGEST